MVTFVNKTIYQETFQGGGDTPWLYFPAEGSGAAIPLETGSGNTYLKSEGPWALNSNFANPGAGNLHIVATASVEDLLGSNASYDFNGAKLSFSIRTEDLVLPADAHLYFYFQAYDENSGQWVNYVLSSENIEASAVDGTWTAVTITLSSDDADWTALGSNAQLATYYGEAPSVSYALSSGIHDLGFAIFLGNDVSDVPASGSIGFDNFLLSLSIGGDRTFLESDVNAGLQPLNIAVELQSGLAPNDIIEVSGGAAEDILGIIPGNGIALNGSNVLYNGITIAQYSGGTNGDPLSITFSVNASATAVQAVISSIGYANASDDPTATRELTVNIQETDAGITTITDLATLTVNVIDEPETDGDDVLTFDDSSPAVNVVKDSGGYDIIDASEVTDDLSIFLTNQPTTDTPKTIFATPGTEIEEVHSGQGNDLIYGYYGPDQIYGNGGNDIIFGLDGDDTLNGGDGDDILNGGAGADYLAGGAGNDTADYSDASGGVVADLNNVIPGVGDAAGDVFDSIENLTGSQFNDQLYGDNQNNVLLGLDGSDLLSGGAGDDKLYGGDGDDLLIGGEGADLLDGGDGFDRAVYTWATSGVTVALDGSLAGTGEAAGDTFNSVEGLEGSYYDDFLVGNEEDNRIRGLGGNDIIYARAGADIVYGGDGDDNIYGEDGDDMLYGEAGDDNLQGGAGADYLDGGDGIDAVYYTSAESGVVVDLSNTIAGTGDAEGDVFVSIENVFGSFHDDWIYGTDGDNELWGRGGNDVLFGRDGNDVLKGQDGNDHLYGGAGDDFLYGGADNDHLQGGEGADYLDGGAGFDMAVYSGAASGVFADLSNLYGGTGDAAGDIFVSIEGLSGSAHDDILYGDAGGNYLLGGAGDDLLYGRAGNDYYHGGEGSDLFWLGVGSGHDVIQDFEDGIDLIVLYGVTYEDLLFDTTDKGTIIYYGEDSVEVWDTAIDDFSTDDFMFV